MYKHRDMIQYRFLSANYYAYLQKRNIFSSLHDKYN